MTEKRKPKKIHEEKTSIFLVIYTSIYSFFILYYGIFTNNKFLIPSLFLSILLCLLCYYNYTNRKILVTENKIYLYKLGKKTGSISFINDFHYIDYHQSILGRIFNYGTIFIVNNDKFYYKIHFICNPKILFEKSVIAYEDFISKKDSTYVKKFNVENKK